MAIGLALEARSVWKCSSGEQRRTPCASMCALAGRCQRRSRELRLDRKIDLVAEAEVAARRRHAEAHAEFGTLEGTVGRETDAPVRVHFRHACIAAVVTGLQHD